MDWDSKNGWVSRLSENVFVTANSLEMPTVLYENRAEFFCWDRLHN